MLVIRFDHRSNVLEVGEKSYKATCLVRNELNGWRKTDQVVKTYPTTSSLGRKPYYPRKFPTGTWEVKPPIWTDDPEFWPVKIPTDAVRRVLTWEVENNKYTVLDGDHQEDAFYHLHFSKGSNTTLGCIRLDSAEDAIEIAKLVESHLNDGSQVWLEVIAGKN